MFFYFLDSRCRHEQIRVKMQPTTTTNLEMLRAFAILFCSFKNNNNKI